MMGQGNFPLQAFNRGEIGRLALGRVDVDRLRLSAEEMVNWVPHTVGPMSLRPGLAYAGTVKGTGRSYDIPFVFSITDTAILEQTAGVMRVVIADQTVMRPAVASNFPAGAMTDASLWTVSSSGGGLISVEGGFMTMSGHSIGGYVSATARMNVGSPGIEHALRIFIGTGPITLKIGTSPGADDLVAETIIDVGVHSLAFTPPGDAFVQFDTQSPLNASIGLISVEAAGPLELPTSWSEGMLPSLRYEQSGDVIFVACAGIRQKRIERRGPRSWSIVDFQCNDGPFQAFPAKDARVTFNTGLGYGLVTANRAIFRPSHVGALIRAFTPSYNHTFLVGGKGSYMPSARISGVGVDRTIAYSIAGDFVGTWELQRSLTGEDTGFSTVASGTTPTSAALADGLDNSICWYRLGFQTWTSGVMQAQIIRGGGGRTGIARIVGYDGPGSVFVNVLKPVSSNGPTDDWRLGDWSDVLGWPSSVALHDGRLCFAGRDRFWTSVSDAYNSFADTLPDGTTVGDASAISRSIGYGPVAVSNWLLPLSRLIAGAEGSEISIRSSALDAPLTPSGGVTIKDCSTQGSARVAAVKCDKRGLFVQKSGQRLYQLAYDVNSQDYEASDMNRLHPDLNLNNPIIRIAVQRQPNTRIHCIRADGTAAILTFEPGDEVEAWWRVETDGAIEDVVVLPDAVEDRVYYTVRRTISGSPVRYRERFARLDQARGGALNRQADAHVVYQGAPTVTIGGLAHLEGRTVIVWGDGQDLGSYHVSGGAITLPAAVSAACVGLPYSARFKSAKLAYAAQGGTALNQIKRVVKVGLILADVHAQGLQYGQGYDVMDDLPLTEGGGDVDEAIVRQAYDEPMIEVPGDWDTDARLCLTAAAPRPVTVMACSITVETNG
jgi:hypothetical protein